MKTLVWIAASLMLIAGGWSTCHAEGMQDQVDQATTVIEKFKEMPESGIPEAVLRDAKGLAILTVLKAGFIFSGQGGWGIVVARNGKSWSGPSGIGTGGAGFGLQVGAEVTEFVMVLNTPEAVNAFAHGANITIGGDLTAAVGPIGRDVAAGVMPIAAVYTYSRSQGLFAGVSLQGTVIAARNDANEKYYGRKVTPKEILSGSIRPPRGADALRLALQHYASERTADVQELDRQWLSERAMPAALVNATRGTVDTAATLSDDRQLDTKARTPIRGRVDVDLAAVRLHHGTGNM